MRVSSERQLGGRVSNFELSLIKSRNPQVWLEGLKLYTRRWIEQHRNGFRDRSDRSAPAGLSRAGPRQPGLNMEIPAMGGASPKLTSIRASNNEKAPLLARSGVC